MDFIADTLAARPGPPRPASGGIRNSLRFFWLATIVVPWLWAVGHPIRRAVGMTLFEQQGPRELTYPTNADSVVTWPLPQLLKAVPALKGLEPDESQEDLPGILQKVGENVRAFFENFPNTASVEKISMEGLGRDATVLETETQKFQYLALTRPLARGVHLDEYRTNAKGEVVEPGGSAGSYFITKGFVSMPLHFHPDYQADSTFRYLGRQVINKRQTYVVGFAQRPGIAHLVGRISIDGISILVLTQGIAWIDSAGYQVIRMRTDLLKSNEDIGPKQQTTESEFREVRFKESPQVLWLPRQVVVTMDWKGYAYQNRHRYSNFKLFTVGTEQKVQTPEDTPPERHDPDR
jgi:hypothetical protein